MTGDPEREPDDRDPPTGGPSEPAPPTIAPSALRAATEERPADAVGPGDSIDLDVDPVDGVAPPDAAPPTPDDAGPDDAGPDDAGLDDAGLDGCSPDDPATQAWREVTLSTRIEALLFVATEPLSLRRLQTLCGGEEPGDVRDALASLDAHYAASARAFSLVEIGGGYQLRTRSELTDLLAGMGRKTSAEKLSPAAVETLAIVAYRQPVLRVDVEKIRGVASGEVLRGLIEKGLIRVAGRADLPGSPLLYGTTPTFLELFGLKNVQDLPSDRAMLRRPL